MNGGRVLTNFTSFTGRLAGRTTIFGLTTASAALASLTLAVLIFCGVTAKQAAAASKDAVDCASISMSFDVKSGYELNCEEATRVISGFDSSNSYVIQHLEATSATSNIFVDAFHYTLTGRVILTNTDLRNNLKDFYGDLAISDWQSGRALESLATAEFRTEMRGLPSHCVAFQRLGHRDWGGYKKLMIGVSCSQDDIEQAYSALKYLYLPH